MHLDSVLSRAVLGGLIAFSILVLHLSTATATAANVFQILGQTIVEPVGHSIKQSIQIGEDHMAVEKTNRRVVWIERILQPINAPKCPANDQNQRVCTQSSHNTLHLLEVGITFPSLVSTEEQPDCAA